MYQIAVCDDEKKIVEDIRSKVKSEFDKRMVGAEIMISYIERGTVIILT